MKRLVLAVASVTLLVAAPTAWAAPGGRSGPPVHGCAQAGEDGVGGAYHSTCDGSPSLNGNGDGKATGKPCAGCVGAADNKNPPGQAPDGSDANNGYECDGNSGVGKTNPAHTGCVSEPYSGARVQTSDERGNSGSKRSRPTSYRIEESSSGATGGGVLLALGVLVALTLASRPIVRRLARR